MAQRRKRFPPNNVQARRKPCIDCLDEGVTTKRKAPHPGPRCATHHRAKRRVRSTVTWAQRIWETYGITEEEYWSVYEYQEGYCFICRRANGRRKRLSVDHCHSTGTVRGLLCTSCNRNVLGHLRDDPEALIRAATYLKKPPAVQVLGLDHTRLSIIEVIQRYYPDWDPPPDHRDWNKCLCPFHGESTPSAAVSYDRDGFNCFACDVRGDAISIIRHEEEVSFAEAVAIAERLSVGSNVPIQRKPPRKPSRRVFGEPGDTGRNTVRAGIRGRSTPWT